MANDDLNFDKLSKKLNASDGLSTDMLPREQKTAAPQNTTRPAGSRVVKLKDGRKILVDADGKPIRRPKPQVEEKANPAMEYAKKAEEMEIKREAQKNNASTPVEKTADNKPKRPEGSRVVVTKDGRKILVNAEGKPLRRNKETGEYEVAVKKTQTREQAAGAADRLSRNDGAESVSSRGENHNVDDSYRRGGYQDRRTAAARRRDEEARKLGRKTVDYRRALADDFEPEEAPKKKLPIFKIGFLAYIVVLVILAGIFLGYTHKSLVRYENSQAENFMASLMKSFEEKVDNGEIIRSVSLPATAGVFEEADVFGNMYLEKLQSVKEFTYEKNPKSYSTESPVYDIYGDGEKVAQITLGAQGQEVVFAILTVIDWKIEKISPAFSANTQDYTFWIPDTYKAKVNGVEVSADYLTGKKESNDDYKNIAEYVTMPSLVEYKIPSLVNKPTLAILDENGTEFEAAFSEENYYKCYSADATAKELPDDIKESAMKMAKTWDNFLTVDASYDTVTQYLIEGNYYYNLAKEYANSPDRTFISDHDTSKNYYTDEVIDNYTVYADNCYSVHVAFVKHMTLTRTGEAATSEVDSTFFFVKNGDKWALADMVATTN